MEMSENKKENILKMVIMNSPVPNRRSRKIHIDTGNNEIEAIEEDQLHNQEDERNLNRQQLENENILVSSPNGQRVSLSEKSISDHFQSCIQLAAENKINAKNAFSLKLIDWLHTLLSKRKTIKDFTEVSSSLDAAGKIYSCRVDNVHSDTLRMATSICSTVSKTYSVNPDHDGDAAGEKGQKKKRCLRKARKTTLACNTDQINRVRNDNQNYVTKNCLTNEELIMSSALFDWTKHCWHLDTSSSFWEQIEKINASDECLSIEEHYVDVNEDAPICPTFKNFQFGGADATLSCELEIENDFDSLVDDFDNSRQDSNLCISDINMIDACADVMGEPKSQFEHPSQMMSSSDFISDISKLISSETSEYRYFNFHLLQKKWSFRNMKHWNPDKKMRENETRKSTKIEKKLIDFNDLENVKIFDEKIILPQTLKSVAYRDKFLVYPVMRVTVSDFFRCDIWREMFIIPKSKDTEESSPDFEQMIPDYDYNNRNDSQHFIPEQYEDDYIEDTAPDDVHEAIEKNNLTGDNLIEIPNKVAKIQLPHKMSEKSVNMRELKLKIWNRLESFKSQIKKEEDRILFSSICKHVMFEDIKSAEEFTVPILFNAILQLANDKNLYFQGNVEQEIDFIITLPD